MSVIAPFTAETFYDDALETLRNAANGNGVGPLPNMRVGIYNVLDYGAEGDGTTDDTEAIQDAIDAAGAAGGGTVYFPEGRYLTSIQSAASWSSGKYALLVKHDNVTLLGVGNRKSVIVRTDEYAGGHWTFLVIGNAKSTTDYSTANMLVHDFNLGHANYDYYDMDTVAAGDGTITLTTAADAANFAASDFICIRTGQTLGGQAEQGQPDAEMNRIVSANASTGVLTLRYPTVKPYAQEYWAAAGMNTNTTTTPSAYPAKFGVANVNDDVIENFRAEGLHFEQTAASKNGSPFSLVQVFRPALVRCTAELINGALQSNGPWRFFRIEGCESVQTMNINTSDYFSGDKCCADLLVVDSDFTSRGTKHGRVHMNEGTANIAIRNTRFSAQESTDTTEGFYQSGGRGYNHSFIGCDFNGKSIGPHLSLTSIKGVTLDGNNHHGQSMGIIQDCERVVIGAIGDDGTLILRDDEEVGGATVTPRIVSRVCHYNDASPRVICTVPRYHTLLDIKILVETAFNAGSPTISVGTSVSPTGFATATAVSALGFQTVTRGASGGHYLASGSREVIATITPDGSSAGRAIVYVTYAPSDYVE